jgi:hypothetical protein
VEYAVGYFIKLWFSAFCFGYFLFFWFLFADLNFFASDWDNNLYIDF